MLPESFFKIIVNHDGLCYNGLIGGDVYGRK